MDRPRRRKAAPLRSAARRSTSPPPARSSGFRASDTARAECGEDEEALMIAKLNIDERIVENLLNERGITKLSPLQRACFEPAMQGRDMIVRAKTGAGKTLAFGIPIMDKILKNWETNGHLRHPLALVLAPTGELAKHVEMVFRESAHLDTFCAYLGMTIEDQATILSYGVDAVFGTPECIIDLTKIGALHLKNVQFVVLDGADQMLAVSFEAVDTLLENLPSNVKALCSPTQCHRQ